MAMRSAIFWMRTRFFSLFSGRLVPQLRSIAWRFRTSSGTTSRVASWVAVSLTLGALPASSASFQRSAQRHQQSPGLSPGKPNSGTGVERSLPAALEPAVEPRPFRRMQANQRASPCPARPAGCFHHQPRDLPLLKTLHRAIVA